MTPKIGIIGSGGVAKALAGGFIDLGYSVMIGSGDHSKLSDITTTLPVHTGTFNDSARFGDVLILAVKGSAALKVLNSLDNESVKNKIIIDTSNPISDVPPVQNVLQFFTLQNESLGQQLQQAKPDAYIVKAFNSVGAHLMYKPQFKDGKPSMFICGNHMEAKEKVTSILSDFGWLTEDMGSIESAGSLESLCILWCIRGFKDGQWSHAFKLLK